MFRSPLAVIGGILCGWIAWGLLWVALYAIGHRQAPGQFPWPPPPGQLLPLTGIGWLLATLALDVLVGVVTGWMVARLAPRAAFNHTWVAVAILSVGGLMSIAEGREMLPTWIAWCRLLLMPPGVLAGAWLHGEKADVAGDETDDSGNDDEPEAP